MPAYCNYIGIDPSIISTGMVVNGKVFNYCRKKDSCLKSGKWNKWFEICSDNITIRHIDLVHIDNYSDSEINKIKSYDAITDLIITDINENINKGLPTKIGMEGYAFSSMQGYLVDLVTFSTLLRRKLLDITDDIEILSPSTLKLESCKMTYPPTNIGIKKEKLEWRNNQGVMGGSFTKTEMFVSIIENESFVDDYANFLKDNKEFILSSSDKIMKPLNDTNDSYLLYQYIIKK